VRSCVLLGFLLGTGHRLSADVLYSVTDLGTLGEGVYSHGLAINDEGQITGSSFTSLNESRAVLYSDGHMTDLGTLDGSFSAGSGINDRGQVTGTAATIANRGHAAKIHRID
jgi:probable HAF family extracellular repeat protein